MKKLSFLLLLCFPGAMLFAQQIDQIINEKEVHRIENVLASDEMEGRRTFTPAIDRAADFIAAEFQKAGLLHFDQLNSYRQTFSMVKAVPRKISGTLDGKEIFEGQVIPGSTDSLLLVDNAAGFAREIIGPQDNFFENAFRLFNENKKKVIWVHSAHKSNFGRLSRLMTREQFESKKPILFILADQASDNYSLRIENEITRSALSNVVGMLPGKSKKNEFVIFSAHYDHMGIGKPDATGDSIYNGANDDASGTTAVIMLAKYFSQMKNNERSLLFVAFTAEEIGGFGSQYFSKSVPPEEVMAMFNIEMIGTDSKWGKNSAYITGYERSDFGKILQANLVNSNFRFEPDPYPDQNLFYRSDNATLAALGVPAHTISTSKMDNEPNYHKPSDEISTLDLANMTEIIKSIAISSQSIIKGVDTPSRVAKN